MADFSTYAAAEARVTEKVQDGTWLMGHSARATTGGKIAVRVQRPMTSALTQGGWAEITDDAGE